MPEKGPERGEGRGLKGVQILLGAVMLKTRTKKKRQQSARKTRGGRASLKQKFHALVKRHISTARSEKKGISSLQEKRQKVPEVAGRKIFIERPGTRGKKWMEKKG